MPDEFEIRIPRARKLLHMYKGQASEFLAMDTGGMSVCIQPRDTVQTTGTPVQRRLRIKRESSVDIDDVGMEALPVDV